MRQSCAALAIIEQPGDCPRWLVQWNERWQAYSLVGGHRADDESFRDCLRREVTEELGLEEETGFQVGDQPLAQIRYQAYSASAKEMTEYVHELFDVKLLVGADVKIGGNPATRWVTRADIDRSSVDGRSISEQVLDIADVLDRQMRRCEIDFMSGVNAVLPPDLRAQLERELNQIFSVDYQAERVLVSRSFGGYSPKLDEKIVLGVELKCAAGFQTHIVKIGDRRKVEPDARGWQECTRDRQVASRILAPVQKKELGRGRVAVIYRDAYILFGLNQQSSRPETLETAAEWAVRDDRPDPISVERAISHICTDLGRWFFPGAVEDTDSAIEFYRKRLRFDEADRILPMWTSNESRRLLRRDAVWLMCGRDKPDADPLLEPARYLDPVDFVAWMVDPAHKAKFPETLVGRSHGDLHGRNILVGVRRGEVEYPAVFDYGEMGSKNVLAWDFAKLEMELKVRLLPPLLANTAVRSRLVKKQTEKEKEANPLHRDDAGLPSERAERAERISMFLAFEEWLHGLTARIHTRDHAETLSPLAPDYSTGIEELDRLVSILLRIRKEAALWLGFEHHQRQNKWRDELYFALAVYGLLNVRWDYDIAQTEYALICSGFAAARMPLTPVLLRECIDAASNQVPAIPCPTADTIGVEPSNTRNYRASVGETQEWSKSLLTNYPSYRIPLAVTHGLWRAKDYCRAKAIVDQAVFELVRQESGDVKQLITRPEVMHAVPLIAEGSLIEIECGLSRVTEDVLEKLRVPAREFGDFETLGRIGRLFKEAGDARWDDVTSDSDDRTKGTAFQMYSKALTVYEEAFLATRDYYTGINAATLALLTGDTAKATKYAEQVLQTCRGMTDIKRDDRYWVFASEGEACLLLKRWEEAARFYQDALRELSPGQGGMANSTYKQLCRLWKVLGDNVERSLEVFEQSEFRVSLTPILQRRMPA